MNETAMVVTGYVAACAAISVIAYKRNYSGIQWFLLSLWITPMISWVAVWANPAKAQRDSKQLLGTLLMLWLTLPIFGFIYLLLAN